MTEPNKSGWGGKRDPGGGRPPEHDQPRKNLVIRATDKEYKRITDNLGTRERTEILLQACEAAEE